MTNAQPEPSMEEILASIRRIISEDEEEHPGVDRSGLDAPNAADSQTVDDTNGGNASELADVSSAPVSDQDAAITRMLDRTEARRGERSSHSDADVQAPVLVALQDDKAETLASLVSDGREDDRTVDVGDDEFDQDHASSEISTEDVKMVKQQAAAVRETDDDIVNATTADAAAAAFGNLTRSVRVADGEGKTLEAIVTDMMRPMVKEWLDTNLSRIVEEKVEYEVQRLARRG